MAQFAFARRIAWIPLLACGVGLGLLVMGVRGFYVRGSFGLSDAAYCGLLVAPAAFLLLVMSYVAQHAKVATVMPVLLGGLLVYTSNSFAVAMGIAVTGAAAGPIVRTLRQPKEDRMTTPDIGC